ncbi:MAG: adenine phosphoribosyltransferase [Bacteroidetes bacterium]|nr:adenine phosphoribosyltransferase [Bacteroidota bacterium]
MQQLENDIKSAIRNIPDFPKPGINFKDITPVFKNPELCTRILEEFSSHFEPNEVDAIVGIESRGFLFGLALATRMRKPFVLVRKAGKLPAKTAQISYALEYGEATIEMHEDALEAGARVVVHDDLLATGGTAEAAAHLCKKVGAQVVGFSFLVDLSFLNGKEVLKKHFPEAKITGLATY